ncbi:MAG: histidine kinase [Rhizobacter sp.]|nr:histidine kinase [Ferruginibacter sp.]
MAKFNSITGDCIYKDAVVQDSLHMLQNITASSFDKTAGKLWIITANENLFEYNLAMQTLIKYDEPALKNDGLLIPVNIIHTDSNGILWIGKGKTIIQYDPVGKKVIRTLAANSNIFNISSDKNRAWFTTKNEIGSIDKTTGRLSSFNVNTLLTNVSLSQKSLLKDNNGHFWLGSNSGFCIIDPEKFKSDGVIRRPYLTGFKVFDKPRNFELPYNDIKEIELNYKDNFFSFTFSTFDFGDTRSAGYAYKLDPFDKEWKFSNETPASYTNVPPGNYKLLVRPANFNSDDTGLQKELLIRIKPPFWKTNWFIICLFILFAAMALWLWKTRKKALNKQKADATIDYFANSVYGENSTNEICWDIARNCISQLQFEDCVVYLMDDEKNVLVQKAAYGPKNPKGHDIINPITIRPGEGIVGTVLSTGKLLLIDDTGKDDRYIVDDMQRFSELAVPILHNDKVIGVIDSENTRKHFYTPEHVKAMTTIASISGNKIAEAQAREYARENEIKLLEIKKMLAESQLMALRAQMNPHFVFNCLNSIQECIVTNKYKEATTYLNKFSKLFRMVLNNSGKNLVTLQEEKNVLELYLELEYMRFENKFSYTIYMDEELESEEILIPSMLLQPYVENALWHGLMHKEGDRALLIRFEKISEEVFRCSIDDNGIGRQKSFELKERQSKTKRHESKGLSISSDRLDVLTKQGYHAQLQIIDKPNQVGTTVIIELSTFLKN